jgi:hypothetical protein
MIISFTNFGSLYAQPSMVEYLRECKQILPPPPTTSGTTLCEQHPNFVPDEGLNLIGTNFASQLVPPTSAGLSGKNISISGTLLIDRTFQFSNCNIKMDNNAIIAIIDENRLTILSTDLFACEEMWDGIKIETGSRLSLFFSNVEDAEAALQPDENAPMFLISNDFHRNRVGIRNTDGSVQGGSVIFDLMMRNTFSSDGPLNDGTFAFAGIHLTQTAASIGHSTLTNDFTNIDYGIVSENSDIQVRKCVFENLTETTPVTGFLGGEGIHTSHGTLIADDCNFSNCRFAGIAALGTNLTITDSNFDGDMIVGIISEENNFAEEILIKNNIIEMNTSEVLLGISLQRSTASGNLAHNTIEFNDITLTDGVAGIFAFSPNINPALDDLFIRGNNIDILSSDNQFRGIEIVPGMANGYKLHRNTLSFDNNITTASSERYGIACFDAISGTDHEILLNSILGEETDFPAQCGIHIDNAVNIDVCFNTVDHTHRGVHFQGQDDNCVFSGNSIQRHGQGLFIANGFNNVPGIIGDQIRHCNTWSTTPGDYTINAAENVADEPSQSEFIIETIQPNKFPTQISPLSGWFSLIPGSVSLCDGSGNLAATEWDDAVAAGQFTTGMTAASIFNAEYQLALKLMEHPTIPSGDPDMADFLTNNQTENFYKLASAQNQLASAMIIPQSTQEDLDSLRAEKTAVFDSLYILDSLRVENPDTINGTFDTAYIAAQADLLNQLATFNLVEKNIKIGLDTQRISNLQSVKTYLNGISTTFDYETNLSDWLTAVVDYELGNITAENFYLIAETMVSQYDSLSGPAVYQAGHFTKWCNSLPWDYENPTAGSRSIETEKSNVLKGIQVYPNPTENNLYIKFENVFAGEVRLIDLSGKVLVKTKIPKDSFEKQINLKRLPNGIYTLTISDENQALVFKEKIVILK